MIEKNGYELELGRSNRKFFLKVYIDPLEIWVDFKAVPDTAYLCALHDAIPIMQATVGKSRKIKRSFVNIEWLINEWGGDKDIIEAIKRRKQRIIDDLPRLKEKYG